MATIEAPAPTTRERVRPEWLENIGGQLLALVAALVLALLLGSLIILAYGESPAVVYGAILTFSFGSKDGFGYVISIATPLIFSALAVAVCFKGGMFNIGVEGQYLVGMVAAAWAALKLDFLPGPLLMWVTILFGMLGAVAFALVPAVLKVRTGAHEVVTTIMMNGIAISLVAWAINGPLHFTQQLAGFNINLRTDPFKANARIPDLGHRFGIPGSAHLSWLFPMALVTAAIVWFVLKRMRLGYEARAVGASSGSAQAGGISIGSVQIKLFILSGALAGLVGMQQLLADKGYLPVQYEAALGFTGIAVAFLGQNSPLGIVLAAILWGVLARGETAVQIDTNVPREFVIILQGILIISVVVTYQLAQRRLLARQLRKAAAVEELGDPAAAVDVEGLAKEDR
jgi:ABC-type uncharacterized transport system permease subunit